MENINALFIAATLEADDDELSDADALLPSSDWYALMADRLADFSTPLAFCLAA